MSLHIKFDAQLTVTKNLYQLARGNKSGSYKLFDTDFLQALGSSQFLQSADINSLVLYAIDILEAELRQTTLQRHLSAFKTYFLAVAGTLLRTLVSARRSASLTRAGTTSDTLTRFYRTISRFQSM